MPLSRRTLAPLAALLLATPALAQANETAAVEAAVERLRELMLNPDAAGIDAIFADQLTYGHSDGRVQNKAEMSEALIKRTSRFNSITLSRQTVNVMGDLAVVRHHFDADTVSNGNPGRPSINIVQVWQKQGGRWRLLVRQAH